MDKTNKPKPMPEIVRLRAIVEETGLPQIDIAERAGLTQSNLSRAISGRINPSLEVVKRILEACGADWRDLFSDATED